MKHSLFLLIFSFAFTSLFAKTKLVKCEGTYTYTYSTSISYDEAKAKALDYAITRAIADEIGTTINSASYQEFINSRESFDQVSRLVVKGKWVRDIHEPIISQPIFENNLFFINVTVSFYAQPLEVPPVTFNAHILRNGLDDQFASDCFNNNDKLYVSFSSNKAGYVAIFLEGTEGVLCALPYFGNDDTPYFVKKGIRYVFFNVANNTYHVSCENEPEINFVHILYSPNSFIDGDLTRQMPRRDFREWLGAVQSYDEKMQVQSILIKVYPQK